MRISAGLLAITTWSIIALATGCPTSDDDVTDDDVSADDDDTADDDTADDDTADDDTADDDTADDDTADDDTADDDDTSSTCSIEVDPETGSWTPDFAAQTNCTCSPADEDCHTLYIGSVASLTGNQATLEFTKTNAGGGPSVDVSYWVVVGADEYPSCVDLDAFVSRTDGTWPSGVSPLNVPGVDVWPSEADFDAAPEGETKRLFVISGGQGYETERIWFQQQAITFTKVCD